MTVDRLVAEATRKSGLVWVRPRDGDRDRDQPVWHVWADDSALVVAGGLEQPFPATDVVVVSVRSRARQGDLLVRWVADVQVLEPGSAAWTAAATLLHAERLNAPDGEEQPARWARESRVLRLVPTGELLPD